MKCDKCGKEARKITRLRGESKYLCSDCRRKELQRDRKLTATTVQDYI